MVKVPGGKLLSTMAELRQQVEQATQASPQRLTLARAYLDSLDWGIKGLATMGQRIGFQILEPNPPQEYPKMLYKNDSWRIAANPTEEQSMLSDGFSPRVPVPLIEPPIPFNPPPPTISIALPVPPPTTDESEMDE